MQHTDCESKTSSSSGLLAALLASMLVGACGGGDSADSVETTTQQATALMASGTTTLQIEMPSLPDDVAAQAVQPAFHMAPMLLNTPDDVDGADDNMSAHRRPHRRVLTTDSEGISTRQLTPQLLAAVLGEHQHAQRPHDLASLNDTITPMAAGSAVSTYSPAQIRSAYGLPALPAPGVTLSAAQSAQFGAGQTIYIVDAKHNPNVAAELAAFNQKFSLPTCQTQALATTNTLPLPAAPITGCQLLIVYNTTAGAMTSAAPAANEPTATGSMDCPATNSSVMPVILVISAEIGSDGCRRPWKGSPTA